MHKKRLKNANTKVETGEVDEVNKKDAKQKFEREMLNDLYETSDY